MIIVAMPCVLTLCAILPSQEVQEEGAVLRVDGARHVASLTNAEQVLEIPYATEATAWDDGAWSFAARDAHVDIGPSPRVAFDRDASFTVRASVNTTDDGFCTPLMCREGDAVHYSLVMGRRPGTVSFEVWSWGRDKAISTVRVDDGRWHDVVAAYDSTTQHLGLWIDGSPQVLIPVRTPAPTPSNPTLRLGNNLGADQPFGGSLRDVTVRSGVPAEMATWIEERAALRILEPAAVADAFEQWLVDTRRAKLPRAASAFEWNERATRIRAEIQDALGLWPPPYAPDDHGRNASAPSPLSPRGHDAKPTDFVSLTPTLPLDVRHGGSEVDDGVRLTRVAWRAFEGYDATGWLYEPETPANGLRAAVLCPHGHWQHGARHPVVQARCLTLARKGFVVLAVDSAHTSDDAIGLSPLGVMMWANLRGLELLRARPDVDAARIGCTGASGGGQQTFYLTALDSGLAAAAPAVMLCCFEEILLSSGVHCGCNFVPYAWTAADEPMMAAAFAPKPQLVLSVTGDWTHAFPQRGYPELRDIYRLYEREPLLAAAQWNGPHDYHRDMRNVMVSFFQRHLQSVAAPDSEAEPLDLPTRSLDDLARLDTLNSTQDFRAVSREFRTRLAAPRLRADALLASPATTLHALRERLRDRFPAPERLASTAVHAHPPIVARGQSIERWSVASEPHITLPVWLVRPTQPATRTAPTAALGTLPVSPGPALRDLSVPAGGAPLVVCIATGGASSSKRLHAPWVQACRDAGAAVLFADVRYTGELDQAASWRDPYGRIFGRDEATVAVHDIRTLLEAVPFLGSLDTARILLVADGDHGPVGLIAAALDARVSALITPRLGPLYRKADRRPAATRILRHADLDDIACLVVPRRWWAGGITPQTRYDAAVTWAMENAPRAAPVLATAPLSEDDLHRAVAEWLAEATQEASGTR